MCVLCMHMSLSVHGVSCEHGRSSTYTDTRHSLNERARTNTHSHAHSLVACLRHILSKNKIQILRAQRLGKTEKIVWVACTRVRSVISHAHSRDMCCIRTRLAYTYGMRLQACTRVCVHTHQSQLYCCYCDHPHPVIAVLRMASASGSVCTPPCLCLSVPVPVPVRVRVQACACVYFCTAQPKPPPTGSKARGRAASESSTSGPSWIRLRRAA